MILDAGTLVRVAISESTFCTHLRGRQTKRYIRFIDPLPRVRPKGSLAFVLVNGLDVRVGCVGQHNLRQNNEGGSIGGARVQPNINLADSPVVGSTAQSTALYQPLATISAYMDPAFHSTMNSRGTDVLATS
jgi:hypothetical protein